MAETHQFTNLKIADIMPQSGYSRNPLQHFFDSDVTAWGRQNSFRQNPVWRFLHIIRISDGDMTNCHAENGTYTILYIGMQREYCGNIIVPSKIAI